MLKNTMDGARKQRGNLKEKSKQKDDYIQNQKETEFLGHLMRESTQQLGEKRRSLQREETTSLLPE